MRYIAGNKFIDALNLSKKLLLKNRIPVINYAVENNRYTDVYHEYEYINKYLDDRYRIALKLSSLNYDIKIIDELINMYKEKNIKILKIFKNEKFLLCMYPFCLGFSALFYSVYGRRKKFIAYKTNEIRSFPVMHRETGLDYILLYIVKILIHQLRISRF